MPTEDCEFREPTEAEEDAPRMDALDRAVRAEDAAASAPTPATAVNEANWAPPAAASAPTPATEPANETGLFWRSTADYNTPRMIVRDDRSIEIFRHAPANAHWYDSWSDRPQTWAAITASLGETERPLSAAIEMVPAGTPARLWSILREIGDSISPTGERPDEALGTLAADVATVVQQRDTADNRVTDLRQELLKAAVKRDAAESDRNRAMADAARAAADRDEAREDLGALDDLVAGAKQRLAGLLGMARDRSLPELIDAALVHVAQRGSAEHARKRAEQALNTVRDTLAEITGAGPGNDLAAAIRALGAKRDEARIERDTVAGECDRLAGKLVGVITDLNEAETKLGRVVDLADDIEAMSDHKVDQLDIPDLIREAITGPATPLAQTAQDGPADTAGATGQGEAVEGATGPMSDAEIVTHAAVLRHAQSNFDDEVYDGFTYGEVLDTGHRLLAEVRRQHTRPAPGLGAKAARDLLHDLTSDATLPDYTITNGRLVDVLTNVLADYDGQYALRERSDRYREQLARELAEARTEVQRLCKARATIRIRVDEDFKATVDSLADAVKDLRAVLPETPGSDTPREMAGLDVRGAMSRVIEYGNTRVSAAMAETMEQSKTADKWRANAGRLLTEIGQRVEAGAPQPAITGETSDGYHTFNELYTHRAALFAALCRSHPELSWRSRQHQKGAGDMYPGMFIAGMDLSSGQVSYHVESECWDDFDGVPILDHAPVWDGHTPNDVIDRLLDWRPAPVQQTHGIALEERRVIEAARAWCAAANAGDPPEEWADGSDRTLLYAVDALEKVKAAEPGEPEPAPQPRQPRVWHAGQQIAPACHQVTDRDGLYWDWSAGRWRFDEMTEGLEEAQLLAQHGPVTEVIPDAR